MQHKRNNGRLRVLAGPYLFAILATLGAPSASAQDTAPGGGQVMARAAPPVAGQRTAPTTAKRYFIDFRSRSALSYGHTFAVYGRLNAQGKIVESHVAGLSPFTESSLPWMVGHVIAVPSETGPTDGDNEDQYITASYRVLLNEAEYRKVVAYIKQHQANSPMWHALLYNCNSWVGDIATFMGLKTPYSSVLLYPAEYITSLREINGGQRYLDPSFAGASAAGAYASSAPAATAPAATRNAGSTASNPSAASGRVASSTGSAARRSSQAARGADATRSSAASSDPSTVNVTGTANASPPQSVY